jgi:arylsulfatase A-like enzyme
LDLAREAARAQWQFPPDVDVTLAPAVAIHRTAKAAETNGVDPDVLEARVFLRGTLPGGGYLQVFLEAGPQSAGQQVVASSRAGTLASIHLTPGWNLVSVPLAVLRSSEVSVGAAAPPSRPPPFTVRGVFVGTPGAAERPASAFESNPLEQEGPSRVLFAFPLPQQAELRFTPTLSPPARGPVRVGVTFETEAVGTHVVWSSTLEPGSGPSREITIPLPGVPGTPARLGLTVEGEPSSGAVSWLGPRVLARGPQERIRPHVRSPGTPPDAAERAMRERLAGLNVLVVVLDAAAAGHFGCYGYPRDTTPEVDRLAREGALFETAYTPAPFTIAAVSSLRTSLQPEEHHGGVRHNAPLPAGPVTLAELLSARGVATAGFVANPSAGVPFGLDRGFEEFHSIYEDGPGRRLALPRAEQFRPVLRHWLERMKNRAFYGYIHYLEPHFPYDPPPPFDRLFGTEGPLPTSARRDPSWVKDVNAGRVRPTPAEVEDLVRLYDGNLAYVDGELGWLRRTLEELSLLERTLIVVTADHGEDLFRRGVIGHGALVHEESTRVPLILRYPAGRAPAGLRLRGVVDLLDVAPTVADIFGVPEGAPGRRDFEGQSLLSVLAGGAGKVVTLARTMQERPTYALRSGQWTLLYSLRLGGATLYDLAADPGEREDVAARHPLRVEVMRQAVLRWRRDMRPLGAGRPSRQPTREEDELLRSLGYVR